MNEYLKISEMIPMRVRDTSADIIFTSPLANSSRKKDRR